MVQADAQGQDPELIVVAGGSKKLALTILSLTLFILSIGVSYGWLRYGSLAAAMGAMRGDPLLVDQPLKTVVGVRPGDRVAIRYDLTNASNRPIALVGMDSSCSCTVMDGLPLSIAPFATKSLTTTIDTREDQTTLEGTMQIYTDHPHAPQVVLGYTLRFSTPSHHVGSYQQE